MKRNGSTSLISSVIVSADVGSRPAMIIPLKELRHRKRKASPESEYLSA